MGAMLSVDHHFQYQKPESLSEKEVLYSDRNHQTFCEAKRNFSESWEPLLLSYPWDVDIVGEHQFPLL